MRRFVLVSIGFSLILGGCEQASDTAGTGVRELETVGRRDFEPAWVVLDLGQTDATAVLGAINRQVGIEVPVGTDVKDQVLAGFRAAGTFWEVMDELCRVSGNIFRWSDRKG